MEQKVLAYNALLKKHGLKANHRVCPWLSTCGLDVSCLAVTVIVCLCASFPWTSIFFKGTRRGSLVS